MKKFIFILCFIFTASLLAAGNFGVGFGLGLFPMSEGACRSADEQNKKWIEYAENIAPTSADATVEELSKATGISPTAKLIYAEEYWLAQFTLGYMFTMGGNGKITVEDSGVKSSEELSGSATSIFTLLTFAPRISFSKTKSAVYAGLGVGYQSLTYTEEFTAKANSAVNRATSYNREFSGSALFIPFIFGIEVDISDTMTLNTEGLYRAGTILGQYDGKQFLGSPTKTTQVTTLDYSGITLTLGLNIYFN